jgi:hypothetical protein
MKAPSITSPKKQIPSSISNGHHGKRGFALIATISVMVLLVMIALAMLSLSTIELRASQNGRAMAEARANARMALMIAIGELQKSMGPDQRVSAPAQLVHEDAPRGLTGVWRSHHATAANPSVDPNENFLRWLVSSPDHARKIDVSTLPTGNGQVARLMGEGTLGADAAANDLFDAPIVGVDATGTSGAGGYAYAVLDEAVKARIDLEPRTNPHGEAGMQARLGEAVRFGAEAIPGIAPDGFPWWENSGQARAVSLASGSLLTGQTALGQRNHDLTVWTRGVLSDTARGGLRGDLSVLCDNLPTDFINQRIYSDSTAATAPSNPYWAGLRDFATRYRTIKSSPTEKYQVSASVPDGFTPYLEQGNLITSNPGHSPNGAPLVPVVTKVEMVFSILTRDPHVGMGYIQHYDPLHRYMLYMVYSPVITIYNPYNIPMTFYPPRIRLANIPIGLQFYINGEPQNTQHVSLNQCYIWRETDQNHRKEFYLKLVDQRSGGATSAGSQITLAPGETRIYGSAVDPNWSWADEDMGNRTMFDWNDDVTSKAEPFELSSGWNGPGVGFSLDYLHPKHFWRPGTDESGAVMLRPDDMVNVSFEPLMHASSNNQFTATIELDHNGQGDYKPASVLELAFDSTEEMQALFADRLQDDIKFPALLDPDVMAIDLYERNDTPIKDYASVRQFAHFTFSNKTAIDAGTASRPGTINPATSLITRIDAGQDPAIQSMEVTMLQVENPGAGNPGAIEIDPQDRGYSFTGNTAMTGVRSFPLYEVPTIPPQSIAQIRHAGLANSGHLPHFAWTAGESWAHPLLPRDKVVETTSLQSTPYLDHSWLANTELWDSWFFSTICSYEGAAFGNSQAQDMEDVLRGFLTSDQKLLNTRLDPRVTTAAEASALAAEVAGADDAYRKTARHLWVKGPFNVNSLSVDAWKAVLSSLNKAEITYTTYDNELDWSTRVEESEQAERPLLRHRRPAGPPVNEASAREDRWRGFRQLGDEELEALAEAICEVIRERGPFLSLADFVNRDPESEELDHALRGALQEAIDRSDVNKIFSSDPLDLNRDGRQIPLAEVKADGFAFPEAIAGDNFQGAPSYISQGDILSALGTAPTVHSDTFRIRSYGETVRGGKVVARAWCEAIVQRTPDFIDPQDSAETRLENLTSGPNRQFGRRFKIVGFRWLSPDEI